MKLKYKLSVALCAASLSPLAFAQFTARPDPAEAGRPAPKVEYQSVFSGYQPFREQKGNPWKEVNQEVADNPGMVPMGAMKDPSGKSMAGVEDKSGKGDMAGHGAMAGDGATQSKLAAPAGKPGAAESHSGMAMAKPQASAPPAKASNTPTAMGLASGTGVILQIDKANGKVKMTHEPIAALGWPRMTMFFRLKDNALADRIKEGEKVDFSLEKAAAGYVISGFGKPAGGKDAGKPMDHDMHKGEKK